MKLTYASVHKKFEILLQPTVKGKNEWQGGVNSV